MSSVTRLRLKMFTRIAMMAAATCAMTVQGIVPADAFSLKSSGIRYLHTKTAKCASGKYGFLFVEGNHLSYKKVYWKNGSERHWSNTIWTGYNGDSVLVKILGKTGGNRYARAYLAVAPETRRGMSSMSKLHYYTFCDSRDLTGNNYGDAHQRLTEVWRKGNWKLYR
jgi:hypothetical protein